jgi:predicted protein tyrosine phosphatase
MKSWGFTPFVARVMHAWKESSILPAAMNRETIYVGPLSAVEDACRRASVSHLVTLINDETMIETPTTIAPGRHLRLTMNDIAEAQPGLLPPDEKHVTELIDFALRWEREAAMLIHCWAGISRSTAAAFITQCVLNPDADEYRLAEALRAASPTATPNRRLVALGDKALERQGRRISAVEAIGHGRLALEADLFSLPARVKV